MVANVLVKAAPNTPFLCNYQAPVILHRKMARRMSLTTVCCSSASFVSMNNRTLLVAKADSAHARRSAGLENIRGKVCDDVR